MVSIVIPLYNKEKQIAKTLQTVLNQSYQDFEIVIVNDGSTDRSVDEVKKFYDYRIRLVTQQNAGVSAARNRGIEEAKGEYIALLDADDEWHIDYLTSQIRLAKDYPLCDVFVSNYLFKDRDGKTSQTIIRGIPFTGENGILSNYFVVAAASHPPMWTSAVMARKSAFMKVGGFPTGIKSGEDLLTWARLACEYKIAYSKAPLATFNVEGYDVREKPKRIPAEVDVVGNELERLAKEFNPNGIKNYIAHWHKMRSSVYMRLGMRRKSIREAFRGLRHQPTNHKLLAFITLNLLPSKLQPF